MAIPSARHPFAPVVDEARAVLRAYGQVVFGGHPLTGALLLLVTLARPAAGGLGLLAVLVAHAIAAAAGYARETRASGYYGYNALLVGLALAESHAPGSRLVLLVAGGGALAALLSAVLGDWLRPLGLPVLALPFVIVTSLVWHTTLAPGALPFWVVPEIPTVHPAEFHATVLAALGAVVFQPTALAGVAVLVAVAVHSRITATALLAGALLGALVARELGPGEPAFLLPAAYNGALTFASLGAAFYVPGRAALGVAAVGAALTAWLTAALLMPFAPLSVPVLAWPFVAITLLVMRSLGLRAAGRAPFRAPLATATPEANLEYRRVFAKRLMLPGPPRFVLPVSGPWLVTQGVGGDITHQGPWRHALDFEVVDRDGFPFRGDGTTLEDYYCFGRPVLAPGHGVVAAVHDGAPDNAPGAQDLARPWGNAVVLQHGPELFSVVAHLRRGSIRVAPGQTVAPGQPLAHCGASGRSPRPHLHFQAQASAELGAATLDFRMIDYQVVAKPPRFERLGVPAQGMTVQAPALRPFALGSSDLVLYDQEQRRLTLRPEVTLLGEQSIVDVRTNERLFFVSRPAGTTFTALRGSADGLLGALFQTIPDLPGVDAPRLGFDEELPPETLLPAPLRLVYQLIGSFVEPASARVRGELVRNVDHVVVESECEVRFFGRVVRRRRGRVEVDGEGLARVELSDAPFGRALFSASRLPIPELYGEEIDSPDSEVRCVTFH